MERMIAFRILFLIVLLLIDIYLFFVIRTISFNWSNALKNSVLITHIILSVAVYILLFTFEHIEQHNRNIIFSFLMGVIIGKIIMLLFFLIDDVRRGIIWLIKRMNANSDHIIIKRSGILSWLGIVLGTAFIGTIVQGFTNVYNYQIRSEKIVFKDLPQSFNGLKIIQFSDAHLGSLKNQDKVAKGIDMINREKPDIVFFTGDLVNSTADEAEPFIPVFSKIQAPLGVYSILGNHDYGDYFKWNSPEEKTANLQRLKDIEREMGWKLLLNENVVLEKNGEKISIVGVENWSDRSQFPKYGRLDIATAGTENIPFKILLTHDPSHWDHEVNQKYKDIDLTLSGHTHAMQYGFKIGKYKWSPSKYIYKQWSGKYQKDEQVLYVNIGFGVLGYAGRFSMLPEITVIELTNQ